MKINLESLPKPKDRKLSLSDPEMKRATHPVAQFALRHRGHGLGLAALAWGPRSQAEFNLANCI